MNDHGLTCENIVATLPRGPEAACYGYYSTAAGADWLLVVANGITGYVHSGYLEKKSVPEADGGSNKNKKEDDDMVYYEKLFNVPSSYKPTIRKLMEKGVLKGRRDPNPNSLEDNVLDVSEDYCRIMTTLDRLGKLD